MAPAFIGWGFCVLRRAWLSAITICTRSNKLHPYPAACRRVVDFIFNLPAPYKNNFVKYTVDQIKEDKILDIFNKLNGIYAIGDKLASFYLRDVILIFDLEKYLQVEDLQYCQPVDTWVKQVAIKLDIISSQAMEVKIVKLAIINACKNVNVSPLLFNAGAWMVGARSFELLIEKL